MSFEWQTEDERSWQQPNSSGGDDGGRRPARRWPWLLLLVGLLATGAYFAWQQVQERVDEATEVVRDEVRASHSLANRAAQDRDQELFVTLLSGRSATWTDAQKARLERGLLFADTGRLFGLDALDSPAGEVDVNLNPDLTEAILTVAHPVIVDAGAGLTETVVISQTHVFRKGSQRWLLSPPDDDTFWGTMRTWNSSALRLVYPQRDEELALRLGDDLERKLFEMCRTVVDCPADFQMQLRLETDPQSILVAADGHEQLASGGELTLPAPTLVGLPVDEAAYAALFRGYASHLVSAALVDLFDYTCCELMLFQQAMLDWQLSRLSLRSAPIAPEDYLYVIDAPLDVDHLLQLSRAGEPVALGTEAPLEVHAFVDFLRGRLSMRRDPLNEMHRSLSRSGSFWNWVGFLTEYETTDAAVLQQDWSAFVWDKAREAQELAQPLPPEATPQQDLVAVCGGETISVYRYAMATGEWSREMDAAFQFALLTPLRDGNGYVIAGQLPAEDLDGPIASYMQRGSNPPFELQAPDEYDYVVPVDIYEPESGRVVVWTFNEEGETSGIPGTALLDPATCAAGDCHLQRLPGMPIWTPEGRQGLVIDMSRGVLLFMPEGRTEWQQIEASVEVWPFWLDTETFGYVRERDNGMWDNVMIRNTASDESQSLIRADELRDAVGRYGGQSPYDIVWAGLHPFRPGTILLLANLVTDASKSFLISLTMNEGQTFLSGEAPRVTLLAEFDNIVVQSLFGRPLGIHGDYLVLPTVGREGDDRTPGGLAVILYDLRNDQTVLASNAGSAESFLSAGRWSADGRWFARDIRQAIDILSPAMQHEGRPHRQLIFHDFERCVSVSWINRQ